MGIRYPERPVVGVGSLVFKDGMILLVKRASPPGRGLWSLPGGVVELGEPLLEAAARELLEETGIKGKPIGVVNVDEAIITDESGRIIYHYVLVTVLLEYIAGEPIARSDALDARFFTMEEARKLDLTESVRGLLDKMEKGIVSTDKILYVVTYSPSYSD